MIPSDDKQLLSVPARPIIPHTAVPHIADCEGAIRPPGGPVCSRAAARDDCHRRRCVADFGRSGSQSRRVCGGDALSAYSGSAGRLHRRRRAGSAARHFGQRQRAARGAGANTHRSIRQDWHADRRRRAPAFDRTGAGRTGRPRAAAWRGARASIASRAGRRGRAGGARSRLAASYAARCARDDGIRHCRRHRWSTGKRRFARSNLLTPRAGGVGAAGY
jgi:hypothetical protein